MRFVSILAVPVMICGIIAYGMSRRIDVYDCFTEGARDGLEATLRIIAPLVGLMVAISMFRASGALEILAKILKPITEFIGMPSEVLPLAILRPVSGSGSIAVVSDILKSCGADSIEGKIASVMMGSTETTFYTVAVYFGAVGIKRLRHTVKSALIADTVGIVLSVVLTRLLIG